MRANFATRPERDGPARLQDARGGRPERGHVEPMRCICGNDKIDAPVWDGRVEVRT